MPEAVYSTAPPVGKSRTLAALYENSKFSQPKRHLGSKHPPILPMEPSNLVLDKLHLLLRIGDILLRNVIPQADSLEQRAYMTQGVRSNSHICTLELLIRQGGVSFTIAPVRHKHIL